MQADIYQDEDDSRKDDIASLKVDQGDFKVFYDRVRDLKDYYRNRPIEVTEVSAMQVVSELNLFVTSNCRQCSADATALVTPCLSIIY